MAGFDSRDSLFNIRTQLLGEYRSGAFRVGAELFDSRAYGEDLGTPIFTRLRGQSLTEDTVADSRLAFGGSFGRADRLS